MAVVKELLNQPAVQAVPIVAVRDVGQVVWVVAKELLNHLLVSVAQAVAAVAVVVVAATLAVAVAG